MPISEKAMTQWGLKNCTALCRQVWAGESEMFGPVILKQSEDREQLAREFEALSRMPGTCKAYGLDEAEGFLLEERILPGIRLREEPSLERRMTAFQAVFDKIHILETGGESYLDWLEKACFGPQVPESLKEKAERAWGICQELLKKYPQRVLLHGDLHHDNILLRSDGSWAVIDPKGVIGPEILDLPRFLLNEPTTTLREAMAWMQQYMGYPLGDIRKAYYMEVVLANLWLAEDGLSLWEDALRLAEEILEEIG